jgi:phospholipid/cholesterol/gamma-HCH transport system substrate-binding protein
MENKSHALIAGLFTIVLLVATIAIGLWFNRDREERVPYEIATKLPIPGLSEQASVNYRGLDVGRVNKIAFDPQVPGQILIRLAVRPDTPITRSTWAMLGYQGVTGIAFIVLDDDGREPVRVSSGPEKPARIELRPSLLNRLESRGIEILSQVEEVTRRVNDLLNEQNQQAMLKTFANISSAAEQFERIPRQMQPTLQRLPALTKEAEQTLHSINALSRDLSSMASRLQDQDGALARVGKTADEITAVATRFENDLVPLSTDIRFTLRLFNRTLEGLNERPQSVLFGARPAEPGPGEAGYLAPAPTAAP